MLSIASGILGLALVAQISAHVSLISIYGSNNVIGHAFGLNLYGKYPRVKGAPGDAGGDSGIFQTGTANPSPACGRTPELGPLDIPAWLEQSEGQGLPAAYANMSVVFEAFQVNRDGGGPMSCEYNEDATATSWKPMFMTLNQAGNSGIQNQVRTNETVVANFPADAKCTGGWTQTACIVRCRTGVNNRFGGCFAVKLSGTTAPSLSTAPNNTTNAIERITDLASTSDNTLSNEQIQSIAEQVIIQMKTQGLLISASASGSSSSSSSSLASLSCISQAVQLGATGSPSASSAQAASASSHSVFRNSTLDASDVADNQLYASSSAGAAEGATASNGSTFDASDAADHQFDNLTSPTPPEAESAAKNAAHNQLTHLTPAGPGQASYASNSSISDASDAADNLLHNSNPTANHGAAQPVSLSLTGEVPEDTNHTPLNPVGISATANLTSKSPSAKKRSRKCKAYSRRGH